LENASHRIRFAYTPRHASWLNQVELWFSIQIGTRARAFNRVCGSVLGSWRSGEAHGSRVQCEILDLDDEFMNALTETAKQGKVCVGRREIRV
jgi:hypothetical protein